MLMCVTGLNGAGKTAYAVGTLRRYAARGVPTFANIDVTGSGLVRSFEELMSLRDCVLLLDEATAMLSSRQSQSLPPEALLFFQTLRHSNIGCIITAPTIERVDIALRSLLLKWVALTPVIKTTPKGGIWANTHLSLVRSGRPLEGADGAGAKMGSPWFSFYRPARHHADYNSFADVDLFARQSKFPRTCPLCGLSVRYGATDALERAPRDPDEFEAEYFCGNCGFRLGYVARRVAQPYADAPVPSIAELAAVNPQPTGATIAGPEDLLASDFERLLRG